MSSYDDFKVGFGALITGGVIKVIENIDLSPSSATASYINMHPLGTILVVTGLAFVGAGFIGRFMYKNLKAGAKKEADEDKAEQ